MASDVDVCNRALTSLGATRIGSLTENSVNGRHCNAIYPAVRDALMRAHPWNCLKTRAQLAASAIAPAFGPGNAYPLPADYLRLCDPDVNWNVNDRDWVVENGQILTNDQAPLQIRYIARKDPAVWDPLFAEALAAKLARELCEPLTQSNNKKTAADAAFKDAIAEARRQNAFENVPIDAPVDDWLTARL